MGVGIYMAIFMGFFLGLTWLLRFMVNGRLTQKLNDQHEENV